MYSGLWIFVEWTLSHQFLLIWASCGGQDFSRQDFYPPSWIWLMKSLFLQIKTPSQIIIWVFFTWELGAQSAPSLLCNTVSSVHGHTKSDTTILWSFQRKTLVAISASFLELSIPLVPRSHPRTFLRLTLFSLFPGLLGPKSLLGQALLTPSALPVHLTCGCHADLIVHHMVRAFLLSCFHFPIC